MIATKRKVVFCIDDSPKANEWLRYAIQSLNAVAQSDNVEVWVLSDSERTIPNARCINIRPYLEKYGIIRLSERSTKYFTGGKFPYMTYARLLIPLMKEFAEDDVVAYVDTDVEFADKRWLDIFASPIGKKEVLGAMDKRSHFNRCKEMLSKEAVNNFISPDRRDALLRGEYINAGVLLLSLKNIRKRKNYWQQMTECLDIVLENGLFNDQDAINLFFDIGLISAAYNAAYRQPTDSDGIYLYHYLGPEKCEGEYPPPILRQYFEDVRSMKEELSLRPGYRHCWDIFGGIYVVGYVGYQDRVKNLIPELKRVGNFPRVEFSWDFPNRFFEKLKSQLPLGAHQGKHFGCGFNHYRVIKSAYMLGKESIFIMEDDVRFLKDVGKIAAILASLPCPRDYDMIMLDKNWPKEMTAEEFEAYKKARTVSPYLMTFDKLFSSGCYALSREGMRKWIAAYEDGAFNPRKKFLANDQYFTRESLGTNAKLYCTNPNFAVQIPVGIIGSATNLDTYWKNNEICDSSQDNYNLEVPIVTRENFHMLLDKKLSSNKSSIEELAGKCAFFEKDPYHTPTVKALIPNLKEEARDATKTAGYAIIWGCGINPHNLHALQYAYQANLDVVVCEDGFIRSYNTWADMRVPWWQRTGYSMLCDTMGHYFDATRQSTIETMLNDKNLVLSDAQIAEARRLIEKIVSNKVSKYNHQSLAVPKVGRDGIRKVLVVDQSYGDFSIKRGLADDETFAKMLEAAIRENPDADILVKTHPDTLAGKKSVKQGYYQDLKPQGNVYKITTPINPYSLMGLCDKVYVCSSQFGMEALMAGKEVHTFGMPFYAGWGLTIDAQRLERRTNTRTLEELFYIFYCMYTHWLNPDKSCEATIEFVIDKMIQMRSNMRSGGIATAPTPIVASAFSAKPSLTAVAKSGKEEVRIGRRNMSRGLCARLAERSFFD